MARIAPEIADAIPAQEALAAVDAAVEYKAFSNWWARAIPNWSVPCVTSHHFDTWMASARCTRPVGLNPAQEALADYIAHANGGGHDDALEGLRDEAVGKVYDFLTSEELIAGAKWALARSARRVAA